MEQFNVGAILVAALVSFFLGWAWHSPLLFMKPWLKEMGMKEPSKKDREKMMKGMWKPMMGNFLALCLTAFILGQIIEIFIVAAKGVYLSLGLWAGFGIWLGFIATTVLNTVLWEKRSWKLYFINVGHHLVSLLLMGAILVTWR